MQGAIGGDDLGAISRGRSTVGGAHATRGFFDNQVACRDIPRVQLHLPVCVEPTCRDIAEVQRCAAISANAPRGFQHATKFCEVVTGAAVNVIGEAGGDECSV